MTNIKTLPKTAFGKTLHYVTDPEYAEALTRLTGKKTINEIDIINLQILFLYIKNEFMTKYTNNIYKYDEKEILENIDTFFNSITSKSFFEKEKLIIISRISEKLNSIINEIIEKNIENIRFIFIAKILEKKSKIRNLFEKEKNLICIPCYLDATWMLNQVATNFFRTKKIPLIS